MKNAHKAPLREAMSKFVVSYSLGYEHLVSVGVEAGDAETAREMVRDALDKGILWDDPGIRLLRDEFEESDDNALDFKAEPVGDFPAPDVSVKALREQEKVLALVCQIASLPLSGEKEEDGEPFKPTDGLQDSHDTLMGLIGQARRILGKEVSADSSGLVRSAR